MNNNNRWLVENVKDLTLGGMVCELGGWVNPYANIYIGKFIFRTTWQTVRAAYYGDKKINQDEVEFVRIDE